jgi:adenylate cyclase
VTASPHDVGCLTQDDLVEQLQAQVAQLVADKADLELLLATTTEHATFVEADLARTIRALDEERSKLRAQQEVSERLLLNVLPKPIADRLRADEQIIAETYPEATVLFADIAGFTPLSSLYPAEQLVSWLNNVFSIFDALTDAYGLEKIKTIGDSYMVVGGIPEPRVDHIEAVAEMALEMQARLAEQVSLTGTPSGMRIGICTGTVVAGVIGTKKFIYDLWGDAVNVASRMESHGLVGAIQTTEATAARLSDRFRLVRRGTIYIKGKGDMTTYLLIGQRAR